MSENPIQHARTKHIEIDLHFVREMVQKGEIEVNHIPGTYQKADILTKATSVKSFTRFRSEFNVDELKDETELKSEGPSKRYSKESSSILRSKDKERKDETELNSKRSEQNATATEHLSTLRSEDNKARESVAKQFGSSRAEQFGSAAMNSVKTRA